VFPTEIRWYEKADIDAKGNATISSKRCGYLTLGADSVLNKNCDYETGKYWTFSIQQDPLSPLKLIMKARSDAERLEWTSALQRVLDNLVQAEGGDAAVKAPAAAPPAKSSLLTEKIVAPAKRLSTAAAESFAPRRTSIVVAAGVDDTFNTPMPRASKQEQRQLLTKIRLVCAFVFVFQLADVILHLQFGVFHKLSTLVMAAYSVLMAFGIKSSFVQSFGLSLISSVFFFAYLIFMGLFVFSFSVHQLDQTELTIAVLAVLNCFFIFYLTSLASKWMGFMPKQDLDLV